MPRRASRFLALLLALALALARAEEALVLADGQAPEYGRNGRYVDMLVRDARRIVSASDANEVFSSLTEANDQGLYRNVRDIAHTVLVLRVIQAAGPDAALAAALVPWARAAQSLGDPLAATAAMELFVQTDAVADEEAVWVFFRLCYLWDALDEPDRAMRACRRGNEIVHAAITPDMQQPILTLMRTLLQAPFAGLPPAYLGPVAGPTPVFIVGMARTGTSLLEQMLSMVPEVFAAGETAVFLDTVLRDLDRRSTGDSLAPLRDPEQRQRYADEVRRRLGALPGVRPGQHRVVVDKRTTNYMYLPLLARLLPDARFIVCERDRRDTSLSLYFQYFDTWSGGMSLFFSPEDIRLYYEHYEQLMALALADEYVAGSGRVLRVQYEALATQPEATMRGVLDFLGLPWTPDVLQFHRSERSPSTASNDQVRTPVHAQSVGKWQRYKSYVGAFL